MLVIDGVELTSLHQAQEMGELQGDQTRVLHECPQTCREVPDVRDVGEDVVRDDQIGASMALGDVADRSQEPRNCTVVGMPRDWAASATFFAGSMPRTGMP